MRRPHVYERSVLRARRDLEQEGGSDYGPAARATIAALPALLREAEASGAVTLARHLGLALSEAEGIVEAGAVTPTASDTLVLRWLARRTAATAPAIGTACAMAPGEIRSRLAAMESRRLVSSRQDKDTTPPRRVYFVTGEGKRAAGIIEPRSTS